MKITPFPKRMGYLLMGAAGLVVAAGYLGLSVQLPFGQMDQPGAAIFPVVTGVLLVLASLVTLWEGWRTARAEQVAFPAGADRRRLLGLIALLLGYVLALPWLGQIVTSSLFCIVLMRILSPLSLPRIVVYALLMSGTLYGVFVFLLKVPMPRGVLFF